MCRVKNIKTSAYAAALLISAACLASCGSAAGEETFSGVITGLPYEEEAVYQSQGEYADTAAAVPAATEAPQTQAPQTQPADANIVTVSADPQPQQTAAPAAPAAPAQTSSYSSVAPDALLGETEDAGQEYIDRIIFVGDSTTYGLKPYRMLSGGKETKQVWTPASGTLTLSYATITKIVYPDDGSEKLIAEAAGLKKPELMYITLGVNGVSFMDEDYFKSEYGKLIDAVKEQSPSTVIVLQTIFPIARNYASQSQINNTKITAANQWIAALAQEKHEKYGDVWFLDTYSVLVGSDGWLPDSYQNGDGLHFNEISFAVELENIRKHKVP